MRNRRAIYGGDYKGKLKHRKETEMSQPSPEAERHDFFTDMLEQCKTKEDRKKAIEFIEDEYGYIVTDN
jgi:hypothetical protein|tara:strand:+ start:445 stop:651 length:207 start_codon:yes stop_codon:yes gene_type:complete